MANIKSAIKRNRQNEKRRQRNKQVSSQMKTYTKKALAAAGTDEEAESLRLAYKYIDKAASKGVIHDNAAARNKSRLTKAVQAGGSSED
ncbi:MAG: 30S ribosomal protein S20 [Actinomycetota bacterium]